jgi:4-carboxymuconolactone decarboxylase
MDDHLPDIYRAFRSSFPEVASGLDELAARVDRAGPLDERTQRLVKLGMAIACQSPGAVRSNVRKALNAGDSADEIRHMAALAVFAGEVVLKGVGGGGWCGPVEGAVGTVVIVEVDEGGVAGVAFGF